MTKPKPKKAKDMSTKASALKKASDTTRAPNIEWAKNPDWMWSLISYLTDYLSFCIKLFSDSTAHANMEGRNKAVAKDGKAQQYGVLAKHVFENDLTQAKSYKEQPARLKKEYSEHVKALGQTGAGLAPEDVTEGSDLANLVESIIDKWPWWKEFHSFWHELPNYNPIGVSNSSPGRDQAASAEALLQADKNDDEVNPEDPTVNDDSKVHNELNDKEDINLDDVDNKDEEVDECEASECEDDDEKGEKNSKKAHLPI
ncbi:hypothetical protein CVT25_011531 [Psilocybe cyanescens]|uniref:Uncharacterized protein n=1 Tax=Psilocybe cyanescens TaxID=93625 RepID=A0A409XWJ1_PSICY|nr:hypothetical protein CVT25_011531 [Psilocybe cyanescens]